MSKKKKEATGPRVPALTESQRVGLLHSAIFNSTWWYAWPRKSARLIEEQNIETSAKMYRLLKELPLELGVTYRETSKYIGKLSYSRIEAGEALMVQDPEGLRQWGRIVEGDIDRNSADIWFQFVVCGAIKFG